jgi:carbon-monoxide dehydrogenase medium subunit
LAEDGVTCRDARIVLGAAAPAPMRARETEKLLIGKKLSKSLLDNAGEKASVEADPVPDVHASEEYRRHLVGSLTRKIVKKAWEDAKTRSK